MVTTLSLVQDFSPSDALPLNEAVNLFPKRQGRPIAISTVYRWAAAGYRGVRLRSYRMGAQLFTRPDWIREFLHAMTSADVFRGPVPLGDPARHDRVDRELSAVGLGVQRGGCLAAA